MSSRLLPSAVCSSTLAVKKFWRAIFSGRSLEDCSPPSLASRSSLRTVAGAVVFDLLLKQVGTVQCTSMRTVLVHRDAPTASLVETSSAGTRECSRALRRSSLVQSFAKRVSFFFGNLSQWRTHSLPHKNRFKTGEFKTCLKAALANRSTAGYLKRYRLSCKWRASEREREREREREINLG